MKVNFERLHWENYPSLETPVNADNLNRLEEGVAGLYSDVAEIEEELGDGVGEYVTDWLSEHVDPVGSAVVVDNTLSIEGAAADAKKTGDEISDLKDDFHSYHSELGAGYADQLVSSIQMEDKTPYNFRKVPYDATLEKVEGIVGVDVVLNQLCNGASVTVPNGHKYYMLKGGTASVGASTGTAITGLTSGTDMVFDLTQTFGTQIADYVYSLESATAGSGVAWLKKHFSKIFDAGYIAYNAGTMVHVSGLSAKKTVGFNQWDEQWEVGLISVSNGQNVTGQGIRSKNMCKCFPNTQYHVNFNSGGFKYIFWYDVDGNYIYQNPVDPEQTQTFTSPNNARYFKIRVDTIINYNHDICINLSDSTKNGTYEPYTEHTYPLDSTIDLHGILKLDAQNNLYADGDIYPPSGQVTHRYGIVDMGTLNWADAGSYYASTTALPNVKAPDSGGTKANAIAEKYIVATSNGVSGGSESGIGIRPNGMVYVTNTGSAPSGSLLYELATPTTETAEPYNPNQICDPNGTEEYVSTTVAPVGHITKYPLDIAGRLDNILSMPTADGTYTLRAVVSNGKVTYSWVSA